MFTVGETGGVPSRLSPAIDTVPPEMVVPPVYELIPSVSVPVPVW
jgi:hypothetical protein